MVAQEEKVTVNVFSKFHISPFDDKAVDRQTIRRAISPTRLATSVIPHTPPCKCWVVHQMCIHPHLKIDPSKCAIFSCLSHIC